MKKKYRNKRTIIFRLIIMEIKKYITQRSYIEIYIKSNFGIARR